jgi:phosphoglycerate dehydrogenase-like enzyme
MRILFCTKRLPEVPERLRELLPEHEIVVCSIEDIAKNLRGVDVLIPSGTSIRRDVIESGTFGLIQQNGVGLEKIDAKAATECGVFVARVPGAGSGNAESVAEIAIWLMLSLSRKIPQSIEALQEKQWTTTPMGGSLLDKQICIVGFGDIGSELAARLKPFGVNMTAVREHPEKGSPPELGITKMYGPSELKTALSDADFVVISLMLTEKTHHIINADVLSAAKPGAYLINVARGGLIDTTALVQALKEGRLAGAGLDVFEEEPIDPDHPLFEQNVVALPHIGGDTHAAYEGICKGMAENIRRFANGETPLWTVNQPANVRRSTPV